MRYHFVMQPVGKLLLNAVGITVVVLFWLMVLGSFVNP